MSATTSLARLRALPRDERRLLARAVMLLPMVGLALRSLGLRRTQALLARGRREHPGHHLAEAKRIARIVDIAARRGPYRAKCLPASLALQSLLATHGLAGDLRLGVRRHNGRLEAHAWVEHGGVALLEPGVHERFTAFAGAIGAPRVAEP